MAKEGTAKDVNTALSAHHLESITQGSWRMLRRDLKLVLTAKNNILKKETDASDATFRSGKRK